MCNDIAFVFTVCHVLKYTSVNSTLYLPGVYLKKVVVKISLRVGYLVLEA